MKTKHKVYYKIKKFWLLKYYILGMHSAVKDIELKFDLVLIYQILVTIKFGFLTFILLFSYVC